jgi:F-type H+-transporting ATPase subunit a
VDRHGARPGGRDPDGPRLAAVPRGPQNIIETVYEMMRDFGVGIAGPGSLPYIPIFVGAFLLILFDNWVGLVPPVGKVEFLRAPSSDVNITIGMALVAFVIFEVEGFRKLGVGGYLGKFFPFYEFKNGIGAGIIALFVG